MGAHSQNIRGPTVITNLGVHSFDFSGGPQSKGVVGHSRGGPPSSSLVKVEIDKTSPVGQHKNIVCSAVITKNGEPITHTLGRTEIRIDVPAPPKVVATAPATPGTPAVVAAPVAEKRLSRLEKLRLEQEEREKAQKSTPQKK